MSNRLKDLHSAKPDDADYLPELVELGVMIGSYRTALGINQEEMAKMIGVSRRTMTKIENGRQTLSLVIFSGLLLCLRCDRCICCRNWSG